jgi:hypothetical protein
MSDLTMRSARAADVSEQDPRVGEQGWVPVPDPTELTTQALLREIGALREFILSEIGHVREISQSKFASMERSFIDVANRTAEQKTDTKDALNAALESAKEAVRLQRDASDKAIAKSEVDTTDKIDALRKLLEKSSDVKDEKIEDLKERMNRIEGALIAAQTAQSGDDKKSASNLVVVGVVISAAFLLVALLSLGLGIYNATQ